MTSNPNQEREIKYKSKEDLPPDIVDNLEKINYDIEKFIEAVKYDSEASMREWYNCMMFNAGKTTKDFRDRLDKTIKAPRHPSLNQFQIQIIQGYLRAGLSSRDVVKAIHTHDFSTSEFTVRQIKKKMLSESVDA